MKYGCVWGGRCTGSVVPMVLVCGKILFEDGLLCLVIFYMKLVMVKGEVLARLMVWGDTSCC